MRSAIRHPTNVPVEIYLNSRKAATTGRLNDVSLGGVSLETPFPLKKGTRIRLRIELLLPPFESSAKVVWCSEDSGVTMVGVQFIYTKDVIRMRVVDQLCQIERHRKDALRREGRRLSGEEAAREWQAAQARPTS